MHNKLHKYRHIIFSLLIVAYVFNAFEYSSLKFVCFVQHYSIANNFSHQAEETHVHGHVLIQKIDQEKGNQSEDFQFLVELQDRIGVVSRLSLRSLPHSEMILANFQYTGLKPLAYLDAFVPPPEGLI